ncbi:MAG: M48 family metallopeptidase [Desulfobacteraceae bacterium]
MKSFQEKVPEEFKGFCNDEQYRRSGEYLRETTKFGILYSGFTLFIIVAFWFLKGFVILDSAVRSWGFSPVVTGLFYMGILLILKFIIDLPFSAYSTFAIEEKFGFNKTTLKVFITDKVKSMILSIIIGAPFLFSILLFFEHTGRNAWWICWFVSTLFIIAVQFIVPTWILPLFNKFTPLESGELSRTVKAYADSIHFSVSNIFVMDGSRRSTKSNAFFTGFGKNRRIVLFDTLVNNHSINELLAILAHEMGHYKKRHLLKNMVAGILQAGAIFFLMSLIIHEKALFEAFFMENMSVYAGLIFFGLLYSPIDLILSVLMQISSRRDEFEADRFAVQTGDHAPHLINALKKLSVSNLSNLTPHPFHVFLNYSHPPVLDRISRLKSFRGTSP